MFVEVIQSPHSPGATLPCLLQDASTYSEPYHQDWTVLSGISTNDLDQKLRHHATCRVHAPATVSTLARCSSEMADWKYPAASRSSVAATATITLPPAGIWKRSFPFSVETCAPMMRTARTPSGAIPANGTCVSPGCVAAHFHSGPITCAAVGKLLVSPTGRPLTSSVILVPSYVTATSVHCCSGIASLAVTTVPFRFAASRPCDR